MKYGNSRISITHGRIDRIGSISDKVGNYKITNISCTEVLLCYPDVPVYFYWDYEVYNSKHNIVEHFDEADLIQVDIKE